MQRTGNALVWVIVVVLVVLGGAYLLNKPGGVGPADSGPIKIGGIAPLTGDAASYGVADQRAKMLALDEINAAGGINGRPLQIVWEDSKCNGNDSTTATQKLLSVDKVPVILGGSCSGETLAALALTEPARVLLFSGLSTSPDLTKTGDLFFRTYPSDAFQGKVVAAYASKELKSKKAAVVSENTDFAQGLRKTFAAAYPGDGRSIVFSDTYNSGDTDFRTLVTKLKAAGPDVIYLIPQTPASGELVLKQLRASGVTATTILSDSILDRGKIAANPTLYEGKLASEVALSDADAKSNAFLRAYKDRYNVDAEYPAYLAAAYDSVYLLAEAMKTTGKTDGESLADYFNTKVKNWQGAVGALNFDESGDALLSIHMRKIVGGKVTDLGAYATQ